MKFFFPDSIDMIDPLYDFLNECHSPEHIRQRHDFYAHETLESCPYDGLLVSKAAVDGIGNKSGRYTLAQRNRLYREGVRQFFRLDENKVTARIDTMGDCGAFAYVNEKIPPYSVSEVVDFYNDCGFDYGVSVDHVILGYNAKCDDPDLFDQGVSAEWRARRELTLSLAGEFLARSKELASRFIPVGVAQGWSPNSYAASVKALQDMGYSYVALGGMVPLKTQEILDVLRKTREVRNPKTKLHLLGVTRINEMEEFNESGVVSFDSTAPFVKSFKDDKCNYFTPERAYTAIRIPQIEANLKLQRLISSGKIDQQKARGLEQECLRRLLAYDDNKCSLEKTLKVLGEYESLYGGKKGNINLYQDTLESKPWKRCSCCICRRLSIHVVIFRGAERNRNRGFHNLSVFSQQMRILKTNEK